MGKPISNDVILKVLHLVALDKYPKKKVAELSGISLNSVYRILRGEVDIKDSEIESDWLK